MSHRTAATIQRGQPHVPREDPDVPGTCIHCHRTLGLPNDRHVDQLPTVDPDITAAEHRRIGDHD